MYLKRTYHQDKLVRDEKTGKVTEVKPGAVSGVKILRAGARQNFSTKIIEQGVAEGWLSLGQGKITIKAEGGDVSYTIERAPGYYCCHCNEKLDDGTAGAAHVSEEHKDAESPDPGNPAGYRRDSFYACAKA